MAMAMCWVQGVGHVPERDHERERGGEGPSLTLYETRVPLSFGETEEMRRACSEPGRRVCCGEHARELMSPASVAGGQDLEMCYVQTHNHVVSTVLSSATHLPIPLLKDRACHLPITSFLLSSVHSD